MKFLFYQLVFFVFILINLFQCQNYAKEEYIRQKLYNATSRTLVSVIPPVCAEILLNTSGIQADYISPNGLSGRFSPEGTFSTYVLALEYLYAITCPIPGFPAALSIQSVDIEHVAYDKEYLVTQNKFTFHFNNNLPLTIFAGLAFDKDYKLCGYDGVVRNSGLTFDDDSIEVHQETINYICAVTQMYCNGTLKQYENVSECVQYLTTQVPYGSNDRADQGNVVCRTIHIKLVPLLPSVHCPHVGPTGGGACSNKTVEFYYSQPDFLACAYNYRQNLVGGGD